LIFVAVVDGSDTFLGKRFYCVGFLLCYRAFYIQWAIFILGVFSIYSGHYYIEHSAFDLAFLEIDSTFCILDSNSSFMNFDLAFAFWVEHSAFDWASLGLLISLCNCVGHFSFSVGELGEGTSNHPCCPLNSSTHPLNVLCIRQSLPAYNIHSASIMMCLI